MEFGLILPSYRAGASVESIDAADGEVAVGLAGPPGFDMSNWRIVTYDGELIVYLGGEERDVMAGYQAAIDADVLGGLFRPGTRTARTAGIDAQ